MFSRKLRSPHPSVVWNLSTASNQGVHERHQDVYEGDCRAPSGRCGLQVGRDYWSSATTWIVFYSLCTVTDLVLLNCNIVLNCNECHIIIVTLWIINIIKYQINSRISRRDYLAWLLLISGITNTYLEMSVVRKLVRNSYVAYYSSLNIYAHPHCSTGPDTVHKDRYWTVNKLIKSWYRPQGRSWMDNEW